MLIWFHWSKLKLENTHTHTHTLIFCFCVSHKDKGQDSQMFFCHHWLSLDFNNCMCQHGIGTTNQGYCLPHNKNQSVSTVPDYDSLAKNKLNYFFILQPSLFWDGSIYCATMQSIITKLQIVLSQRKDCQVLCGISRRITVLKLLHKTDYSCTVSVIHLVMAPIKIKSTTN